MTKYYDTVATTEYDGLIASATPPAEVFSVEIPAEDLDLKRGTILLNDDDKAFAILTDDVVVTDDAPAVVTAYRTGHFVRDAVVNIDGSAVTAEQEDELRIYGILLSDAVAAE